MNNNVARYIQAKHIDSFQKLRLLLFLHQRPDMQGTSQDFAEQLYIGDTPLLTAIIDDLQKAGLIDRVENEYRLRNEPEVRSFVQGLAGAFESPLTRLEILDQIRAGRVTLRG